LEAVVALGGIHHAAQHGAVLLNPGHHDPHQRIFSPDRGQAKIGAARAGR
jgi:hypothetical protein